MELLAFEWDDTIREHNEEYGTDISDNENFGYSALSPKKLSGLKTILEKLASSEFQACGDSYLEVSQSTNIQHKQYAEERDKWYGDVWELFDSDDFWEELLDDSKKNKAARKELKKLKTIWHLQEGFTRLSTIALHQIAENHLPVIRDYFKLAELELRRKKSTIPDGLLEKFKEYVNNGAKISHDFQKSMTNIMLVRLNVAALSQNWKIDDVTMYVTKVIDKHGFLDPKYKRIFPAKLGFDKSTFAYFINYIIKHGSNDQRIALGNTAWFTPNKHYKQVQRRGKVYLVPKEVAKLVPRFYFSQKLFSQRYFRCQFFESKKWLISRLKTLHTHTKVPKRLTVAMAEKLFADIENLKHEIDAARQEVQSHKVNNWRRFFYKKTNAFSNAYSQYAYAECQRLAEKNLEIVHVVRLKMQTDLEGVDEVDQYISQRLLDRIHQLTEKFDKEGVEQIRSEALLNRYNEDKEYFDSLYALCRPASNTTTSETHAKEHQQKSERLSDEGYNTYSANEHSAEEDSDLSSEYIATPKELEARGVFETTSKVELATLSVLNFEQIVNVLEDAVDALPNKADDEYLRAAMSKHFIAYLECCNSLKSLCEFELKRDRIEQIETLLVKHGPQYIRKRVGELIFQRDGQEDSWYGFKTLCDIFLQSCSDSEQSSITIKGV